jgi:V/A-type H+-transporting ATPase subunit I
MVFPESIMPVRLSKLGVLVLDDYMEDVLMSLQHLGYVHVVDMKDRSALWEDIPKPYETSEQITSWEKYLSRLENLLKDLGIKKDYGLLDIFKPKEHTPIEISLEEELSLISDLENLLDNIEADVEDNIIRYRVIRNFLVMLNRTDIDVEMIRSSERLYVVLGQITLENMSLIEEKILNKAPYSRIYSFGKRRRKFIVLVSLKRFKESIDETLESEAFERVEIPDGLSGGAAECIRLIDGKMDETKRKNAELSTKLYDVANCKIERLKNMQKLGKTGRMFVLEAWVPKEQHKDVEETIRQSSQGYARTLVVEPDDPKSNVPTLLRERKILSSFRMITEMYGLPKYNEIDPTPFVAAFFIFFMGLMLGDISLGIIFLAGGFLIMRGAGSRSENMASLGKILACSGVSAIFFGFLSGQFMGGALEMLSEDQITLPVFWMSPADEPINFLVTVLVIGVFHILIGAVLGVINNYLNNRIRDMIGDQVSVFLLIAGTGIIVGTGQYQFVGYGMIGYIVVLAGLTALLLGKGVMGLLEITKIVSNIISYVRILALNMASTWMGRIFVLLGSMLVKIPFFGLVATIALLLFSQIFLVFISAFSTFAHAMRLHYVEFFGRFFMGGGVKFSPIEHKKYYTILKDEEE